MNRPIATLGTIPENEAVYRPVSSPHPPFPVVTSQDSLAEFSLPHSEQSVLSSIGNEYDRGSIFALVDRVIPFEACLYHQVLPLSLVDNQLRLGMVDLADVNALDYLRKVLAYLHYGLAPQVIPSDLHHQILSGYLKFKAEQAAITPPEEATVFFERPNRSGPMEEDFDGPPTISFDRPIMDMEEVEEAPTDVFERPLGLTVPDVSQTQPATIKPATIKPVTIKPVTINDDLQSVGDHRHNRETLIVEAPTALSESEINFTNRSVSPQSIPALKAKGPIGPPLVPPTVPPPSLQQFDRSTIIQPQAPPPKAADQLPKAPTTPLPFAVPGSSLPVLQVNTIPYSSDQLLALTPKELLAALLGRILFNGIGRLYFEYQGVEGRILSSDSGVFQTVIEGLPIATFNGLITELKQLTALPLHPVQETVQVEIERFYEKTRLLLRLRLIPKQKTDSLKPTTMGEDATLQILRGSALRFYQQQQVSSLSRDTLSVARHLQRKVEELHRRSHSHPPIDAEELSVMPELQQVLNTVTTQLTEIERQTSTGMEDLA
jgi:Type II secretion system (T2SS), protein E, N-terminal domain